MADAMNLDDFPEPTLPVVYLDWNVVQFLFREEGFDDLLQAILDAVHARAAWVLHRRPPDGRHGAVARSGDAARLRHMLFFDGLCAGLVWEIDESSDGDRHRLFTESFVEGCERRGHFYSVAESRADDPESLREHDDETRASVERAIAQVARAAAESPYDVSGLLEEMSAVLRSTYGNGLPDLDPGTQMTTVLGPAMLYGRDQMPPLQNVAPEDAARLVDQAFRRVHPLRHGLNELIAWNREHVGPVHADHLGPVLLGTMGYERESAKTIRRISPGLLPDQLHGRHALASAIFLTGDLRLARRLEAWAAWTDRGTHHQRWPVIVSLSPSDPAAVGHATAVLTSYARRFPRILEAQDW